MTDRLTAVGTLWNVYEHRKKKFDENLKATSPADINRSKTTGEYGIFQLFG
jgi:hypothetical protein